MNALRDVVGILAGLAALVLLLVFLLVAGPVLLAVLGVLFVVACVAAAGDAIARGLRRRRAGSGR